LLASKRRREAGQGDLPVSFRFKSASLSNALFNGKINWVIRVYVISKV
jgi:hypothetical protein